MALTADQISDLRADVGDSNTAFSEAELQRYYTRLAGAPNETIRIEGVKGLIFECLLNSSAKLHDYTAGAVGEQLSQIYDHLKDRFNYYRPALEAALSGSRQLSISKIGKRLNNNRAWPSNWDGE